MEDNLETAVLRIIHSQEKGEITVKQRDEALVMVCKMFARNWSISQVEG